MPATNLLNFLNPAGAGVGAPSYGMLTDLEVATPTRPATAPVALRPGHGDGVLDYRNVAVPSVYIEINDRL